MPDFRRGAEAIKAAQEAQKKGSGNFRSFAPKVFWQNDGDERYLLFLNSIEEMPTMDVISFIPQKGKRADDSEYTYYEDVIARTDRAIGEDKDPLVEDWQGKPRATTLAVAVELEPVWTEVKGRKRPKGFEVKTTEFERRIRDEDGELTDETETAVAPVVGFVAQSPANFFNVVSSYDASEAPIEETPVKITRVGKDSNTVYRVDGYPDQEVDLSNLVENLDGINYLGNDFEPAATAPEEIAREVGVELLDRRLDELADEDRYERIYAQVDSTLDKWGGKKKDKDRGKPSRSSRPSQRKESKADDAPAEKEEATPRSTRLSELRAKAAKQRAAA